MSNKYTRAQLKKMAKVVLNKKRTDVKYMEFLMKMMLHTGLNAHDIENRIIKLARGIIK